MEIFTLMLVMLLGIVAGTITGLIPGIHINLISSYIIINLSFLLIYFQSQYLIIFIISMGITHTFTDFIPSTLFGIPTSDTALSVLPAHKLAQKGKAYQAISLSVIGSLGGAVFAIPIGILFFLALETIYPIIKTAIPYILILTITTLIYLEKEKNKIFWAALISIFAASLGLLTLNSHLVKNPLLILFTGLFALPTLLHSLQSKTSQINQTLETNLKLNLTHLKSATLGSLTSSICAITPGIGNAQAATLSSLFFKKLQSQYFIVVVSAINTTNFFLSLITFHMIQKARNGSIIAISQIASTLSTQQIILLITIILITSALAFFLTLSLAKVLIKITSKINQKKLNLSLLILITVLVISLTNPYSIIILISATALGTLTVALDLKRVHLMNVLIMPILLNIT